MGGVSCGARALQGLFEPTTRDGTRKGAPSLERSLVGAQPVRSTVIEATGSVQS